MTEMISSFLTDLSHSDVEQPRGIDSKVFEWFYFASRMWSTVIWKRIADVQCINADIGRGLNIGSRAAVFL